MHRGWRWWTADELDVTDEVVVPQELSSIVRRLVAGWRPSAPEELGWVAI